MQGLSTAEAAARLARVGPNALPDRPPEPWWRRLLRQFNSPLIAILLFALAFDLGVWLYEGGAQVPVEGLAIAAILLMNAALGVAQERRSEAALARLRAMAASHAWVVRDGQLVRLASADLVPGDWVRLEAGDRVPADGTLGDVHSAATDESILTGESFPVDKQDGDEAFSGTLVVRGATYLSVTRTGPESAMGRLAAMLGRIEAVRTPLERRVDRLGRQIARGVLLLAAALGVVGLAAEGLSHLAQVVIFAVALAVAAVPEGLPAVLTVALALGVERMAKRRAVVRRLAAVESLGSVTVVATDKTGTLTESRMEVRSLDAADERHALLAAVLANDADLATGAGDPLELGLLRFAATHGLPPAEARAVRDRVSERPFDASWKYMRVAVSDDGELATYVKGAPEVVVERCRLEPDEREGWTEKADAYAREGYRVLALAWAPGDVEEGWRLAGLALFWDPPRAEVPEAVRRAQDAGVRVVMVTGDHPATALAVANQIGLPGGRVLTGEDLDAYEGEALADALAETHVFARVRPEQKLRLVEALQAAGEIVAMTGDGVNDAPALKRSDVGVAMGVRGSDVSREVADLVLLDDNFATMVRAIEEGRGIYANIQKFLRFLFSTNLSEVLLVGVGSVLAAVLALRDASGALLLPLTAAQILWINLVTDGLPALALALDRTPGVMRHPPRPADSPLLDRASVRFIVAAGTMKALLALGLLGLVPRLGYDVDATRAVAFHFMAIGQLFFTYPARHGLADPLPNPSLHAAVAAGVLMQLALVGAPGSDEWFGRVSLPLELWGLVAASAAAAWLAAEIIARVVRRAEGAAS